MNGRRLFSRARSAGALALMLAALAACQSPEAARRALEKRGLAYDEPTFLRTVAEGDVASIRLFLRAGMPVDIEDASGLTPLEAALNRDRVSIVKLLLKNGADVNRPIGKLTPLTYAAKKNRPDLLKLFLRSGADIDRKSPEGFTALMYASARNYPEVARILVREDADPNIRDDYSKTALHYAERENNVEIAAILKEAGGVE